MESGIQRELGPTSDPSSVHGLAKLGGEEGYASAGSVGTGDPLGALLRAKASTPGTADKSSVDKSFLLGFLEDVARRGR